MAPEHVGPRRPSIRYAKVSWEHFVRERLRDGYGIAAARKTSSGFALGSA